MLPRGALLHQLAERTACKGDGITFSEGASAPRNLIRSRFKGGGACDNREVECYLDV